MPRSDKRNKRTPTRAKRRLDFGEDHQQDAEEVIEVEDEVVSKSFQSNEEFEAKESPSLVPSTPEKKRRRSDDTNRDHNQGIGMYFSPPKTTTTDAKKKSMLVTPEKEDPIVEEEEKMEQHVPIYIHKNLNYKRRGQALLDETMKRAFDLVEEHNVIPSDFESNRSYGPLSGTCFEERVLNAYDRGLLVSNEPSDASETLICVNCAQLGHKQEDCPDLI